MAPPLWGDGSFTKASSMAQQPMLASFVLHFMPYRRPNLQPMQAGDAAQFVLSQPRRQPGAKVPPLPTAEAEPNQPKPLPAPESMPYDVPPETRPMDQLHKTYDEMIKAGTAEKPTGEAPAPGK
jgi:cytochrome c